MAKGVQFAGFGPRTFIEAYLRVAYHFLTKTGSDTAVKTV